MPLSGRCLCGDVRFEVDGPFEATGNCHCSMCRKAHGAPFASFVGAPARAFRWLSGTDRIARGGLRPFCRRCGSITPTVNEGWPSVFVPLGLLDGDPKIGELQHMFVGSKAPWYDITDTAPQFDAYPPGMGEGIPFPRKTEPTPEAVRGGCLCGAVAFETPRPVAGPIALCHCTRCRRARAAAHAANFFVELERFRWLRGADKVEQFKVPEADRFAQAFCRDCGGKVPMVRNRAVIPAGVLDDDPGIRPGLHIFVASKAPWFRIADDLPRYDEYAPGFPPPAPAPG